VNPLRKWLIGRGIKRSGLPAPMMVSRERAPAAVLAAAALQFIPVEVAPVA